MQGRFRCPKLSIALFAEGRTTDFLKLIVIFLAVVGWWGRRAGSGPVAAATTPDDLGCPGSAAPQSRPKAPSSATATPRLNPLSSARPSNSHYAMAMAAQIRDPKADFASSPFNAEAQRFAEVRRE